ncbi:NUDIX domain-containing protein [Microbacterium ulmi]|uniref:NUDIX hydrolase n=1 Tax=Microbacterium ulmi TaxID=179095 RepID=A0A7Y2M194_9MICO|nr:NUDIX hydrolase [Microbacterium ulmi]NII70600.1 8-oxo-dGTP pyrophosphatase MutT (NUDIX family) [Microbacterium ulmi]NNH04159.1 NUDIX hydrolase [Microbacterium ulmi]
MTWKTLASRTVYENRWIRVHEDDVEGPDGPGVYGVVELRHPAVFVVALDDEDRVCLVTLDRYATGSASIEVPAGGTDGEDPLAAAQRELLEETGFEAAEWELLGGMHALNGVANAPEHVFLARGLTPVADASSTQREEGIDSVQWMPFPDAVGLIRGGSLTDGESIAALALAGIRLGRFR